MSFKRSRTKPFHALGRRRARATVLMSSWREVQRSDLVVTICLSPRNTLEYVPSVFLGNILDLVWIHCVHLLDVIGQCNKPLSPGILLFICESRLDSFCFEGSCYSHGGSTARMRFLFPSNKKNTCKITISNWRSNEEIWNIDDSCNDALAFDLIYQYVANDLFGLHAFDSWWKTKGAHVAIQNIS